MIHKHQQKLSLLQNLLLLSKIDQKVSFMEESFIHTIANKLEVSEIELDQLKQNPVPVNFQGNEIDRITHLYQLILLMGVDNNRDKKEIQFCKDVGLKMGLNPIATREIIEQITVSKTGTLSPQKIIQIFKTYHN